MSAPISKGTAGSWLRSLKHRDFRIYFSGLAVSFVGTWMQNVATSWLVYRLTGSAFLLGAIGFAGQIPLFIAAPWMGVLVDRYNRRRVLIFTQSASMVQALALALLVFTGQISVTWIFILSIAQGLINAVDLPARQSFIVHLIPNKGELGNAIALNSMTIHAARIVGPSLAGLLIPLMGEGVCFLLNGISFLGTLLAVYVIHAQLPGRPPETKAIMHELRDGLGYAYRTRDIRILLILVALAGLITMPYMTLMPLIVGEVFQGDASILGLLMGAAGSGALGGAIFLASRASVEGIWSVIRSGLFVSGLGLLILGVSGHLALSMAATFLVGFGMLATIASSNTYIQTVVDDRKRGRVMSLFTTAFLGMSPFGSLALGSAADGLGGAHTLLIAGTITLGIALWFLAQRHVSHTSPE